ncbi:MAG: M28 family peptidase [Planctomycetota bacterium]|jgi:hypothetical protein
MQTFIIARRRLAALAGVAIFLLAGFAAASDQGQVAADEVSLLSYRDYLDSWLYTHVGDDRGFGPEHDLAQANIAFLFESYGLDVTLEPVYYSGSWYYNVVGTKVGSVFPFQEYVLGAHYDSVGNPGADDDASGVALVLEAARIISQYDSDYTIRFVAFDREEQGLYGSNAYVADHAGDDILAMVQADMVAYDPGTNHARIYGSSIALPLKGDMLDAIDLYSGGLTAGDYGWISASDHAPFDAAGYQACLLIEGEVWTNPYYHTAQDNFENPNNLNFDYAVMMTRSVVGYMVDHAGVQVPVSVLEFIYPQGRPVLVEPEGGTVMPVTVSGLGDAVPLPGTGMLHYDLGDGWTSMPMTVIADNEYEAVFPQVPCGTEIVYYVSAEAVGNEVFTDPRTAPLETWQVVAAAGVITYMHDDFEADLGWTASGTASAGNWERGVPVGGGDRGDPPTDYDGSGSCCLTGNTDGDSDVDGGTVTLTSPRIDLSAGDADIRYALWYTNNAGSDPNNDLFRVWITDNDGLSWVQAEVVGPFSAPGWTEHVIRVSDHVSPTPNVRVRFDASDLNDPSVVEAAIDAFQVVALDCPSACVADFDGDGAVGITDLLDLLAAWGTGDPVYDIAPAGAPDGTIDIQDLLATLGAWGPCS